MTKTQRNLMIGGAVVGGGALLWYLCRKYCWFSFCCKQEAETYFQPQYEPGYSLPAEYKTHIPEGHQELAAETSALNRIKADEAATSRVLAAARTKTAASPAVTSSAARTFVAAVAECPAGYIKDPRTGQCRYVELE